MPNVTAWVASAPKSKFIKQEINFGPLGGEEVEYDPLNIKWFKTMCVRFFFIQC